MKRIVLFIGLIALLSVGLFAQQKDRIAVFPFEEIDKVLTQTEAIFFYREFSNEFTNKSAGKITVVPRQEVDKLINTEKAFQLSDLSAKAKTAEYQSVLNGTQILSGIIGKVNNNIRITVSLYTYPDLAQLPGGTTISVSNIPELFNKIPELVRNMQNEISGINKNEIKIYKIGDTGPAGGYIFYDKGEITNGWQYLEAAPAHTEFSVLMTPYENNIIPNTERGIGFGKNNSLIIIERTKKGREGVTTRVAEMGYIAQRCINFDINGFKDWFLPSIDELQLMYVNLKQKGIGGFGNIGYCSSTQIDMSDTLGRMFGKSIYSFGLIDFGGHTGTMIYVRAIRSF